ncbi:MAG: hypothetical protein ACHBNF_12410 [Chromatiales bacterium]
METSDKKAPLKLTSLNGKTLKGSWPETPAIFRLADKLEKNPLLRQAFAEALRKCAEILEQILRSPDSGEK